MTFLEIQEEIRQGKNLDLHLQSNSKFVRREVALKGHRLDILINDPAEEVRAAVAEKGYQLPKLLNDRSDWVRMHAMNKIREIKTHNAGYDIVQRIELGSKQFVVGHNPKAPEPFATWQYLPDQYSYWQGHYFTESQDATLDLFRRAGNTMDLGDTTLARSLLTKEDKDALWMEFRKDGEIEAVAYALTDLLDEDHPYDYDALLADEDFMAKAIRLYDSIDHSYENEAFSDNLENLLEEFPQHKKDLLPDFPENPEPVRISPEEAKLLNDLLKIPSAKIPEIYGSFGDNMDFIFPLTDGYYVSLELWPSYEPGDYLELSVSEPPHIHVSIHNEQRKSLFEQTFSAQEVGSNITGSFALEKDGQQLMTLTIQEDEKLRRVGNRFQFRTDTMDDHYSQHNGETCIVKRELTPKENDILINGLMWEAEFPNGDKLHVFDYELEPIPVPERKPSLSDLVSDAQNRNNRQTQQSQPSLTLPEVGEDPHAR